MMKFITKIIGKREYNEQKKDDFSEFFLNAKSKEKAKVIKQVMREATEEQKMMIKKYKEIGNSI